jgi:CheY-like chemotaxis protein
MVVDDDPDIRKTIKKALEFFNPNYNVTCVESGNKCYEMLKENKIPDLILLDIMMPGMSGWMLVDRIRENPLWKKIPVVFLTCRTDEFAEQTGKKISIDYIKKPFDLIDFKKRIDLVFNNT